MMRFHPLGALALVSVLGACAQVSSVLNRPDANPQTPAATVPPAPAAAAPQTPEEVAAVTTAPPPPVGAITAEALDTVTNAQKAAAQTVTEGGERLGQVTASLGDPSEGGLWIKTGLVSATRPGRIENASTGKTGLVELRPGEGGTTMSLSAMRLLGIPLTDIPTIVVYAQ